MTNPDLIAFEPPHLEELRQFVQEGMRDSVLRLGDLSVFGEAVRAAGHVWSAVVAGRVLAVGGVVDLGGGHGEAWLITSEAAASHKFWLVRIVRGLVGQLLAIGAYTKITAVVREDFMRGQRFAAHLGFSATWAGDIGGVHVRRYERCAA